MAVMHILLQSVALHRRVPVNVIIPFDRADLNGYLCTGEQPFRTLYLLHGLFNDCNSWITYTNIESYAEEHNICVVLPQGDNSFYVNQPIVNNDYGTFIGEELVQLTRRMLPLSGRREDTFIGGLSMGGFGANRIGLRYAETFGGIISLSAAIQMFEFKPDDPRRNIVAKEDSVFGEWAEAVYTEKNPAWCMEQVKAKVDAGQLNWPGIYMMCGTDDGLLEANHSFRDKYIAAGAPIHYEEESGGHEWKLWDKHIQRALEWLDEGLPADVRK